MTEGLWSDRELIIKGEIKGLGEEPFSVPQLLQRIA
jgi:hypothetical protein